MTLCLITGARDKKFCALHGGGKRCDISSCFKSAVGGSTLCTAHGGGEGGIGLNLILPSFNLTWSDLTWFLLFLPLTWLAYKVREGPLLAFPTPFLICLNLYVPLSFLSTNKANDAIILLVAVQRRAQLNFVWNMAVGENVCLMLVVKWQEARRGTVQAMVGRCGRMTWC